MTLTLFVLLPASGLAQTRELTEQELRDAQHFAIGNTVWVLYHEIGHLLVDEFQIPVLGREEDAVDHLATLIMLEPRSAELNDFLVAAVDAFFLLSERSPAGAQSKIRYEHGLDKGRAYQLACLMYGSSAETFGRFADAIGLPNERRQDCAFDYDRARTSWNRVLEPHRRSWWRGGSDQAVTVDHVPPEGPLRPAYETLKQTKVLEVAADYLNRNYAMKRSFVLRAQTCGSSNAVYDPGRGEIVICYELYEDFFRLLADHLAQG